MTAVAGTEAAVEILSNDPTVAAATFASLALEEMPTEAHFRRDHYPVPELDPATWRLEVDGAVARPLALSLDRLQELPRRVLRVVLECAGHRRSELSPPPSGIPWSTGAVSEATWAGASLSDVLALAGVHEAARFVVLEGADRGPFRGEGDHAFARALPLAKANHPDTLLAFEMNGEPMPAAHGLPVRAVVPGWYATDSIKWLTRIEVREDAFDGPFEAIDYRIPTEDDPVGPRLATLAVHSLLTSHRDGEGMRPGPTELRGIAWGGEGGVARVEVSIDGGAWRAAALHAAAGPYARTHWGFAWDADPGERSVAVRATDRSGGTQPPAPRWNPLGYANSSVQRVRLFVEA